MRLSRIIEVDDIKLRLYLVVNPFRASMVLGTPGSGKSYAIVNNYIKQQIEKGFAMYIYDYKFPDLSEIA